VGIAAHLCRYYQNRPPLARELEQMVNNDFAMADLLTDRVKLGKVDEPIRMAVAFILITQLGPSEGKAVNSRTKIDLEVTSFATTPFFDEQVAVEWADYRIRRALEYIARAERVLWKVDERNVPLQLALRDCGYKVIPHHDTDREYETITFTK
jgi:hypothetical protein